MLAHKCCCGDCQYFKDFTSGQTRTGPLGANYTVLSGSWDVVSSRLRCTGNGEIRIDALAPTTTGRRRLSVSVNSYNAATDKLRLAIDYEDANNYHFAEAQLGADGGGSLGKRSGGADTLYTTRSDLQRWQSPATLCLNNSNLVASMFINGPTNGVAAGFTSPIGGRSATIKVTSAGQVQLRDLVLDVCAPCSACYQCDEAPGEMSLAVSSLTIRAVNNAVSALWPSAADAGFLGTFDVPFEGQPPLGLSGGSIQQCWWIMPYTAIPGGPVHIDPPAWPPEWGGFNPAGVTFRDYRWFIKTYGGSFYAELWVASGPARTYTDRLATFTGTFICGTGDMAATQDGGGGSATLHIP